MTNFNVILTEECGDALLITYLFLLCDLEILCRVCLETNDLEINVHMEIALLSLKIPYKHVAVNEL